MPGGGLIVGSHTTLVQFRTAVFPKPGSLNRLGQLPDPAAKSTFPVGNSAACTANTSEPNFSGVHLPCVAATGSA
jgi:hypothetical protein